VQTFAVSSLPPGIYNADSVPIGGIIILYIVKNYNESFFLAMLKGITKVIAGRSFSFNCLCRNKL
jgi:hypothetical protein